jgi:integral membrane protein
VKWIPYAHGYIYAFYVLTAIHYAARSRWSVPRMLALILAGTLPVASFIAERRIAKSA